MAAEDARGEFEEPEFVAALAYLRGLAVSCAPPVGVGEFDILCVSAREVIVWYTPAREGHSPGEHAIPTPCLAAAWAALRAGQSLDEAALIAIAGGAGWGRWLLALLAQLPGVRISADEPVSVALPLSMRG